MEVKDIKIEEIKEYDSNPRDNRQAVDMLCTSIKKFGFLVPVVLDKNNVIVCGHTRLMAAKKMKLKTIPCVYAEDLSDEEIREYRLVDNKVHEFSSWDWDKLQQELMKFEYINVVEDFDFEIDDRTLGIGDENEMKQAEKAKKEKGEKLVCTCPKCHKEFEV